MRPLSQALSKALDMSKKTLVTSNPLSKGFIIQKITGQFITVG